MRPTSRRSIRRLAPQSAHRSAGWAVSAAAVLALCAPRDTHATVTQSDGTIIPVGPSLQMCLDKSPTFNMATNPAPGEGIAPFRILTVPDARTQPQSFVIAPAAAGRPQITTFTDLGEGSGFENIFGWYHVGDDPQIATNRHVIAGPRPGPVCPCPCTGGPRRHPDPGVNTASDGMVLACNAAVTLPFRHPDCACMTWTPNVIDADNAAAPIANNIVQVNWTCLSTRGVYRGGPIAFFVEQSNAFVFSTLTRHNSDRDVHWLIYASKNFPRRFYFGFEDLTRSVTNEFSDLVISGTEIVPSCDPRPEICDGIDQNCDGVADEGIAPLTCNVTGDTLGLCRFTVPGCVGGVPGVCPPRSVGVEVCDGLDNNCNGMIDEGLSRACVNGMYPPGTPCSAGTQVCTAGAFGTCVSTPPTTETCDGIDNNCDGNVDEGLGTTTCGRGACRRTVSNCVAGVPQVCTPGAPTPETCNNIDDNCDGNIDEGVTRPCSSACGAGIETCSAGMFGACSARLPTPEVCDGVDNNCNGMTDEGLGTSTCGIGPCQRTVPNCVAGAPNVCMPGAPTAEICDGIDNNCNGAIDEGISRPCSSVCGPGTETCVAGTFSMCTARTPSAEICDGVDNNCNGMIDEGLGTTTCGIGPCMRTVNNCVAGMVNTCTPLPTMPEDCNNIDDNCNGLIDEGLTRPCMSSCGTGAQVCTAGVWGVCMAPAPRTEVCNGLDDDCDGMIDNGVPGGGTCGSSTGRCRPGMFVCRMGRYVCEGETLPIPETCNGEDDNCNGMIDEGDPGGGAMCGAGGGDAGIMCAAGTEHCRMGRIVCEGARSGSPEVCNCRDDDCDGEVDEGAAGLCGSGADCISCECRARCRSGEFQCSLGLRCDNPTNPEMGHCVPDVCGDSGVICRTDQICRDNRCVNPCDGVVCDGGVCVNGVCTSSCVGIQCPAGQLCRGGVCAADVCATMNCGTGQFCSEGRCVATCSGVSCPVGTACMNGRCETFLCGGVTCPGTQTCRVEGGRAVCGLDRCAGVMCSRPFTCVDGACRDNPCATVSCPFEGEQCVLVGGQAQCCQDGRCPVRQGRDRGVATGSGGLGCSVGAGFGVGARGRGGVVILGLLTALALLFRRRQTSSPGAVRADPFSLTGEGVQSPLFFTPRPRGRGVAARAAGVRSRFFAALAAIAILASGCRSEPYCFNCTDATTRDAIPRIDANRLADGLIVPPDSATDVPISDVSCDPMRAEICNGIDDNCNGMVDEGFDLVNSVTNCGACGNRCPNVLHAIPVCRMGGCTVDCDPDYYDRNRDPSDGCEFHCASDSPVELCDDHDNNCDGRNNEGFDLNGDVNNCGMCGTVCRFTRASANCVMGVCQLGACESGYLDLDGNPANGCEYGPCFRTMPDTEVCDGVDNNCNGMTDEGVDRMMDPMNCGACGFVCRIPNGTAGCAMGRCTVASCATGFRDIDGDPTNGCEWVCGNLDGSTGPETCDNRDNNCNGMIDEGVTEACMASCGSGTRTCVLGSFGACSGRIPSPEICNGVDDDCNGMADEGLPPITCGVGACMRTVAACVSGTPQTCTPGPVAAETCNNVDDNCDGMVDEGVTRACMNSCFTGTQTCVTGMFGACTARMPSAEICNGMDDDCNGMTDDGLGSTTCGVGACGRTVSNCSGGVPQTCVPGSVGSETCNGMDDDCDGAVDELPLPGIGGACGMCGRGTNQCIAGAPMCVGDVSPATEVCNGMDDDCDGMIDEPPLPGIGAAFTCGSNVGICRLGAFACVAGASVCSGGVLPGTETCNGQDDDCDGMVDEGLTLPVLMCDRWRPAGSPVPVGVCAGGMLRVICGGAMGFTCTFPPTYRDRMDEAYCDGLDNNCDGRTDEGCLTPGPATDVIIESNVNSNSLTPSIHSNGTAVGLAWTQRPVTSSPADVYFARSVDVGGFWNVWSSFGRVETGGPGANSIEPRTFFNGNNLLLAWGEDRSGPYGIFGRRSTNAGASFFANDDFVSQNNRPSFTIRTAIWPDNTAIAVWETVLVDGTSRHIFTTRLTMFGTGGSSWIPSPPVQIDHAPLNTLAGSPDLAVGAPGVAYVVWRDPRRGMGDVYINRTTDYGATWLATDVRMNTQAVMPEVTHDAITPTVAAAGNTVYVAWSEVRVPDPMTTTPDRYDIYANNSIDGGVTFRPTSVRIETDPLKHESFSPTAIALSNAIGVVVWQDYRAGFPTVRVTRTVDSGATWAAADWAGQAGAGGMLGSSTANGIVAAGAGNMVVAVWADNRDEPAVLATGTPEHYNLYANYSLDQGLTFQPADIRLDTAPLGTDAEQPTVTVFNNIAHIAWVDRRNAWPGPPITVNLQGDIYYRNLR